MPDSHFFNPTPTLDGDPLPEPDPPTLVELLGQILLPEAIRRAAHQRGLASLRRTGDVLPIGRGTAAGGRTGRLARGGRPGA
jgi:hypothetical protein